MFFGLLGAWACCRFISSCVVYTRDLSWGSRGCCVLLFSAIIDVVCLLGIIVGYAWVLFVWIVLQMLVVSGVCFAFYCCELS